MKWKKIEIPGWGYIYEKCEGTKMYEKEINNMIAIQKYGKGWDELAEFERRAIYEVWNIQSRPRLELWMSPARKE